MTGQEIANLRQAYSMSQADFAAIVGVTQATVSRWESTHGPVRLDPGSRRMLAALAKQLTETQPDQFGEALKGALVAGGAMLAAYVLLRAIFRDQE